MIICFIIGCMIGTPIGFITAALVSSSKRKDDK